MGSFSDGFKSTEEMRAQKEAEDRQKERFASEKIAELHKELSLDCEAMKQIGVDLHHERSGSGGIILELTNDRKIAVLFDTSQKQFWINGYDSRVWDAGSDAKECAKKLGSIVCQLMNDPFGKVQG